MIHLNVCTGANESEWSLMKPKTGALEHTGLKWERIKVFG